MKAEEHTFEEVAVGDSASFVQTWTEADLDSFAKLSGDTNPLHMDETYARSTKFGRRVVHGMLAASSFSRLVGMHLPGTTCLYLSQTIAFKKPVFIGDLLTVRGTVTARSTSTRILDLHMTISKGDDTVIEGDAKVQMLASRS